MSVGQNNDEKFRRPTLKKSVLTMDLEGDYASPSPVSNRKGSMTYNHQLYSPTIIIIVFSKLDNTSSSSIIVTNQPFVAGGEDF